MTPTRPRHLLAVGLVVAVLANLVVRLTYGSLPRFPLFGGVTLGAASPRRSPVGRCGPGSAGPGTARCSRSSRRERCWWRTRPPWPVAIMTGAWLGLLVYVAPQRGRSPRRGDTAAAAVGVVGALVLVGGALWLEHCCRTPTPDDLKSSRRVGSGAMTQATGVFLTGGPTVALPTQQRQRRGVLAPVIGLVALGICGLVVLGLVGTQRGAGRDRGRGAVRAAARRPGGGRVPVDRPLGARAAAAAAHRVPVGRLLLRARRVDHQLQRGPGRRRAARQGQRRRHRLHRDRADRRGGR